MSRSLYMRVVPQERPPVVDLPESLMFLLRRRAYRDNQGDFGVEDNPIVWDTEDIPYLYGVLDTAGSLGNTGLEELYSAVEAVIKAIRQNGQVHLWEKN